LARTEALRRNTEVRFQLTSTVDNSCALSTTLPNWVVNIGTNATNDPSGKCGNALLGPTTQWNSGVSVRPFLVQTYNANTVATKNVVAAISTATNSIIVFNSLGQVIWPPTTSTCVSVAGPASSASGAVACIDLTNPTGGTCVDAGGPMTCMRVEVTVPSGQVRMCNPKTSMQGTPQGCLP
jgi:type IV fimbrial biogenesis protein FimT